MRFALIAGITMTTVVGLRADEPTHVCNYRPPERIVLVSPQDGAAARVLSVGDGVVFTAVFEDPDGEFADWNDRVERVFMAAAAEWAGWLDGAATIEIQLRFRDSAPRSSGGIGGPSVLASAESSQYFFLDRTDDGIPVFLSGVIGEIAGLGDPSEEFDGVITVNSDWLADFSFDTAGAVVGSHDLYSIILHELGHILGFAGSVSFGSDGDWKSTFDLNTEHDQDIDRFFFTGPAATDNFGDRAWLAASPHVGDEIPSLMNTAISTGQRLSVGKLELAMLADSGLPVGLFCWSSSSLDEDSDSDGTPDCIDECPDNADLDLPGPCGCDTADTDGDDTLDCLDECPDDPFKIAIGTCGCGVPDADSDGDGTPDCNDSCPDDPGKIEPGECGCGEVNGTCTPMCGTGMAVPMAFVMLVLCMVRRRL